MGNEGAEMANIEGMCGGLKTQRRLLMQVSDHNAARIELSGRERPHSLLYCVRASCPESKL